MTGWRSIRWTSSSAGSLVVRAVSDLRARAGKARLPLGIPSLDAFLGGGLPLAALTEIRAGESRDGGVAGGFALALAARLAACRAPFATLWISEADARRETGGLYAPGLAALGLDPGLVVEVAVRTETEALWAFEAALSCHSLGVAVCELRQASLDLSATRRCALRARGSGVTGFLLRLATPLPSRVRRSCAFASRRRRPARSAASPPVSAAWPGGSRWKRTASARPALSRWSGILMSEALLNGAPGAGSESGEGRLADSEPLPAPALDRPAHPAARRSPPTRLLRGCRSPSWRRSRTRFAWLPSTRSPRSAASAWARALPMRAARFPIFSWRRPTRRPTARSSISLPTGRTAIRRSSRWIRRMAFSSTFPAAPISSPEAAGDGEKALMADCLARLLRQGFEVRGAVASTAGAAWALAHYGGAGASAGGGGGGDRRPAGGGAKNRHGGGGAPRPPRAEADRAVDRQAARAPCRPLRHRSRHLSRSGARLVGRGAVAAPAGAGALRRTAFRRARRRRSLAPSIGYVARPDASAGA